MRSIILVVALVAVSSAPASAQQQTSPIDQSRVDAAMKSAFPAFPAAAEVWQPRLTPDETMRICTASGNRPSKADGDAIQARERARIQYPADGNFIGDWK